MNNPYLEPLDEFEGQIEKLVSDKWELSDRRDFFEREPELKRYLKDLPREAWAYFDDWMCETWEEYQGLYTEHICTGSAEAGLRAAAKYREFMEGLENWRARVESGLPASLGGSEEVEGA
jgi:hypothetical protein